MAHRTISRRAFFAGLGGTAALALVPAIGQAAPSGSADPAVIADWNAISIAVIATDAARPLAEQFYWFGHVQTAVYNAVVGITRRYELYRWNTRGPKHASPQAAAAAAAHRMLAHYFGELPAAQARLAQAYTTSLARIPDGSDKRQGIRYGERAADHIIALRANDGRGGAVAFDMPVAPGVWRPTPTANAPFFAPWLAKAAPFMLDAPSQFRPAAPPALTSAAYAAAVDEVKMLGSKTSTARTPYQTETAQFIASTIGGPLRAALRDLATRYQMDISDSARLFAAVDMSTADAIMATWDSKLHYGLWRPMTAIQLADEDGNPATVADPTWEPLLPNPPYPDYVSAVNALAGAYTRALVRVLGTQRIDLYVASPVTNTTRYYEFATRLCDDCVDARVFAGIHFRFANVQAMQMGQQIADWALDRAFIPK